MKKTFSLTINGTTYPVVPTMGAFLQFKRETGREASSINVNDLEDIAMLLRCCVASYARRNGLSFDLTLEDFADAIPMDDLAGWLNSTSAEDASDQQSKSGKKKSKA